METALDYNCKTCKKREIAMMKAEYDVVFVTISGITYKMATRNLKKHAMKLIGKEYKVSKRHEGNWETYLTFVKNYGKKTRAREDF
jgi:hypothetical protein